MASVDVPKEQLTTLMSVLNLADMLCTRVIASEKGQMQMALTLAGELSRLKRSGFLK